MAGLILTRVIPAVLALIFHALAALTFLVAAGQENQEFQFEDPMIISTELIVMEARPKPIPIKPKPAPRPRESTPLPQDAEPEEAPPPPEPEPEPPPPEPAFNEDRLLDDTLDLAIAQEAERLAASQLDQAAMSYHMGIYQRIVENWSRPVSARNGMRTDLIVHLVPTGDVANVTLIRSSGDLAFDRSAEQAVRRAGHFEVPTDLQLFESHFRTLPVTFSPQDLLR